ncbi:hypothetical protein MRX96_008275 [Rhipicephalus microplus]
MCHIALLDSRAPLSAAHVEGNCVKLHARNAGAAYEHAGSRVLWRYVPALRDELVFLIRRVDCTDAWPGFRDGNAS